jgi:hypothetical protein
MKHPGRTSMAASARVRIIEPKRVKQLSASTKHVMVASSEGQIKHPIRQGPSKWVQELALS